MKNFSWRRKLAAGLAAAGLISPAAVSAQCSLDTNLVANPSFELVDTNDGGPFDSVRILDWADADGDGDDTFAYAYSQNYSGNPAPPGSGTYHFTGGFGVTAGEVQINQSLDVSDGTCAPLISSGSAFYSLSGYFSSYRGQSDFSTVRVRFLDSGDNEISSVEIGGADFRESVPVTGGQRDWGQDAAAGAIPASTASVNVEVIAVEGGTNHDGYLDLVDFQVSDTVVLPALDITVDRDTGGITLRNQTGAPVNFGGYSITSSFAAVDPSDATWLSIADNYDADNDGSVDATNAWSELSPADTFTDLSEADLSSGLGTTLDPGQTIVLSANGAWIKNPNEDLVFQYVSNLEVQTGIVGFSGNGDASFALGDFNADNAIDELDWMILRGNQHSDLTAATPLMAYLSGDLNGDQRNNHTDFVLFVDLFDQANGDGAFQDMIENLPEPSGSFLVLTGGLLLLARRRR